MKNIFIILGLFLLLVEAAFAYEKVYLQKAVPNGMYYPTMRPTYNPYGNYYNYNYNYGPYNNYRYNNPYAYTKSRIQRARQLRRLYRNNNLWSNLLTWNIGKGNLTGYSTPVTKDIYKQMGISPYDVNSKQNTKSPTCNTDLFSSPSGDEMYYTNGKRHVDLKGASGKTGVTIIYD